MTSSATRNRIPFRDRAGQPVNDESGWNRSRNQQRNWETLKQIIALRTLPVDITDPQLVNDNGTSVWTFEFEVEHIETLGDNLEHLKQDCESVPMLVNLTESDTSCSVLDPGSNVWFTHIDT